MNQSSAFPSSKPVVQRVIVSSAAVIAAAVYFVVLHRLIVDHTMAPLALMLIAAPWLIAGASACAKAMTGRPAARIVLGVVVFGIAMGLVARCGSVLDERVEWLAYLENLLFVLSLAGLFASSLFGPREALVTRLARVARQGDMPPAVVRYTRRVTMAWAAFFATAALVSTVLFATASREVWSAFVNLALWPSTVLAFGVEYAIRVRVLPQGAHTSPLDGMRLFMDRDRCDVEPPGREHG